MDGRGLAHRRVRRGCRARAARSSATSPTTTPPGSSRPCRCRTTAVAFRRAASIVCETLVRFDHGAGIAEVLAGDPEEIAGRLEAGIPWRREQRGTAGADPPHPRPGPLHPDGPVGEGAHRRGRRLPVRPVATRGAADLRLAAGRLPCAPARQPVAVPVPARARRDRARRLVTRAARRLRGRPSEPLPDRRHHGADRG